ncbi:unnamed protein product [Amoebophrya sp. A120]|nr:unnamed protein product [Amoebophrya sp. A120]|eukprot:GSA120T00004974001.1
MSVSSAMNHTTTRKLAPGRVSLFVIVLWSLAGGSFFTPFATGVSLKPAAGLDLNGHTRATQVFQEMERQGWTMTTITGSHHKFEQGERTILLSSQRTGRENWSRT